MSIVKQDFTKVNQLIASALKSDVALINQLAKYIILAGGKRLRPKLMLLAANACNYQGEAHIKLAAVIEFIHTATLLHDDVVDESNMRRGRDTANEVFGNQATVLTGDFLYSRSFQMMVEVDNMQVMQILSDTTNVIAEGEVMQLLNISTPEISEEQYLEVIYRKTARLFESATQLGAVIANETREIQSALKNYGKHLGMAFQIIDDVMDYQSSNEQMGKNSGDDLAEGKVTLPLIHAMQQGTSAEKKLLSQAIKNEDALNINEIIEVLNMNNSFDYCLEKAKQQIDLAIEQISILKDSPSKQELIAIAQNSISRKS